MTQPVVQDGEPFDGVVALAVPNQPLERGDLTFLVRPISTESGRILDGRQDIAMKTARLSVPISTAFSTTPKCATACWREGHVGGAAVDVDVACEPRIDRLGAAVKRISTPTASCAFCVIQHDQDGRSADLT
jgi:hypothetical protein